MTVLCVPALEEGQNLYPSLGPQVCAFIESYLVFGPGDLRAQPARIDPEKRALLYRMYEVYPVDHPNAGRRRFRRVAISLRKGSAKTEFAAWIAAAELHPEGPVRCDGFDAHGQPVGMGVVDPYVPMVAVTEEQSDELAYGALRVILGYSQIADDFDIGLERIMRIGGDGKAISLATAPDARDGARTTFEVCDEALALDTLLPTPTGWTTMADVQAGASLLGSDGQACRVLGKSEVHIGRECYRVSFRDGTSIVADGNHLWYSHRRAGCHHGRGCRCSVVQGWRVRRTSEMLDVTTGYGHSNVYTYDIPIAAPLSLDEAPLPVDAYVLGAWLGDGDERNATISGNRDDLDQIAANIEARGYKVSWCDTRSDRRSLIYVTTLDSSKGTFGDSVVGRLRKLGLLQNKHIPMAYLRASLSQRLDLLRGLMDTDGHVTPRGWCTFVTKHAVFAREVAELARTLGYRPVIHTRPESRSRTGTMSKVYYQANCEMVPFRLARKVERCQTASIRKPWRPIIAIERVDSVPVQCVAVDSADHLYLAGEGFIPTHNTHRWVLPRMKEAHRVMLANLPKRKLSDSWMLEITTAPAPGELSVAEDTMDYARQVADGKITDSRLFFFHRQASEDHDLTTPEGIRAAVLEASGPVAEWSDIEGICEQWQDPTADRTYLERVWLNRLVRSAAKAFDSERWKALAQPHATPAGELITLGFDGSRFHDATGIVATHIQSGYQWVVGVWEQPAGIENWEVPVAEVEAAVADAFGTWSVWRMYCDPPYWETHMASWAGQHGDKVVVEWWTNRQRQMAYALKAFNNAIQSGELSHDGSAAYARHVGNAVRRVLTLRDEAGVPLWTIYKERSDSPHKIDLAIAGALSWEARCDALAAGAINAEQSPYETIGLRFV